MQATYELGRIWLRGPDGTLLGSWQEKREVDQLARAVRAAEQGEQAAPEGITPPVWLALTMWPEVREQILAAIAAHRAAVAPQHRRRPQR